MMSYRKPLENWRSIVDEQNTRRTLRWSQHAGRVVKRRDCWSGTGSKTRLPDTALVRTCGTLRMLRPRNSSQQHGIHMSANISTLM
jgi:hypothetical protein